MIIKPSLLLLGAASVFAADQIPISASSVCLLSANPNDCCAGGAKSGEVSINDRTFKFTCSSNLMALNPRNPQKADNAHACASLCADDVSCEGSSFKAHGKAARGGNNCFFNIGNNMDQKPDGEWITFTEVLPSCLESDDRNACCSDPTKQESEILIDNVRWKWTCQSIFVSLKPKGKPVATAHDCASLCASEGCEGVSFRTQGPRKDTCFFIIGSNKDQKPSDTFLSLVKVVDDIVEPPIPEPDDKKCVEENAQCIKEKDQCIKDEDACVKEKDTCKEDLEQAEHTLQICKNNQVDPAKLAQCEIDKLALESAEVDCRRRFAEVEEKRKQCRSDQQKCEKEKGDLNIQKQQCENDKTGLDMEITQQDDEIAELNSQIISLNSKLAALQQSYDALTVDCKGANGNCRTNLYDAEPGDDQCIITAGNKKFKIHYAKLDDEGSSDLGTGKAGSFKDCAEKCANYKGAAKCVRFMWNTDGKDRACHMRSEGQHIVPTKSSRWSSGQLL
ncbi:hypothetical protein N7447_004340 [Penicillium robsamsonii]|uniref:uncharacterized protein n=1 Tax=Penicillium robsamsonii TaxID=1792511 RepID=UPI0025467855|nr:uncharacterized protein N7447_004340 [Penicillium robsamsonii]KAJ5827577.1 hypothetical protein N7447_004340 [Penicillium robsamsonii]